jgi:hypothetical protein
MIKIENITYEQFIGIMNNRGHELDITLRGNILEWNEDSEPPTREQLDEWGISAENSIKLKRLRAERNMLLSSCDWTQNSDIPEDIRLSWQTYRQALRDITETYTSLDDVVWPEKPEG